MSEYLDRIENELKGELGLTSTVPMMHEDNDLEKIVEMERLLNVSYSDEQKAILMHRGNACILACAGSGKALVNGSNVLTLDGYQAIETLQVGQFVFDNDYRIQTVRGVYPQGKKKVCKVYINNGRVIKCCSEHLWTVKWKDYTWQTVTTSEIKEYLSSISQGKANREDNQRLMLPSGILGLQSRSGRWKNPNSEWLRLANKMIGLTTQDVVRLIEEGKNAISKVSVEYGSIKYNTSSTPFDILLSILQYQSHATVFVVKNELVEPLRTTADFANIHLEFSEYTALKGYTMVFNMSSFPGQLFITGVEETDELEEMTCIEVSGGNKIFLTDGCIPTHNTTVSTHLIAKRIKTKEIRDVNKLIYTTYSKKGKEEMEARLHSVLKKLGLNTTVEVRTIHAFFLQILRIFGVTSDIIKESERSRLIKESVQEAGYILKDDDLLIIDNLLSFQVNNLLSDKSTIDCYVNTLEDLTLEQYSAIRRGYALKKQNYSNRGTVIDYDDMQSYLYLWLCKYIKSDKPAEVKLSLDVRNYCQSMWTDFYIDEAQDVCKIQFEILRAMMTRPKEPDKLIANLVFIGDDDQCLVPDTLVTMADGYEKYISEVKAGDKVKSYDNGEVVTSTVIENIEHKYNKNLPLIEVTTESGKQLYGTPEHKAMVKLPEDLGDSTIEIDENKWWLGDACEGINEIKEIIKQGHGDKIIHVLGLSEKLPHMGLNARKENGYTVTTMSSIAPGMSVQVKTLFNIQDEKVSNVKWVSSHVDKVYDLNLDKHHNFYANGILVHNCIYQWRGSDPNIIMSIGPMFDMPTFILSTNYRCKSKIVDYATTGIQCNSKRFTKGMQASTEGGNVKIACSVKEDLCSLSILAANHINYWIASGVDPKNIAVLCRNNFHLAILSNMLLRSGVYCETTADMQLTKSYMYKDMKNLISMVEPCYNSSITSDTLWKVCSYMRAVESRTIASFQNTSGLSLADTLGFILSKILGKSSISFDKQLKISVQAVEKIKYHALRLSASTQEAMSQLYAVITSSDTKENKLSGIISLYLGASEYRYKSQDLKRSIFGFAKYIKMLANHDGFEKMQDFLRVTEQYENGNVGIIGNKLTLSTIHSAKGREWNNVIMFACDNISEPNLESIAKMMKDGLDIKDIYERIDEERRLFYVGNTRAKENLLVITYNTPSVFIMEALDFFGSKGNNSRITEYAKEPSLIEAYREDINKYIFSESSEYYYDNKKYAINTGHGTNEENGN